MLAKPISSEPWNRMNPRYKFGVWLGVRNNSAECFVRTAEGVLVAREVRRMNITRTDMEAFGTTAGCPGCNATRSGHRAQAHSDPCRVRIEECLKTTREGSERLDRRSELLNEALAKEVERIVRRREEIGSTAGDVASSTGVERHADPT